uniref:Uncharacterized protein n=1 Tax=Rhizophora mucronata TaxID=61149 RepID=A0A2P2P3D3_RHIMU
MNMKGPICGHHQKLLHPLDIFQFTLLYNTYFLTNQILHFPCDSTTQIPPNRMRKYIKHVRVFMDKFTHTHIQSHQIFPPRHQLYGYKRTALSTGHEVV